VVARRSLPASVNLVGRRVASGQEAQQAASDGASLLLVEVGNPSWVHIDESHAPFSCRNKELGSQDAALMQLISYMHLQYGNLA